MQYYYIPFTDNYILTKDYTIYKVDNIKNLEIVKPIANNLYLLKSDNKEILISLAEIIARCKFGYLPHSLFHDYTYENENMFNTLNIVITDIRDESDCIWINGMKFIRSLDFDWLYCNIYGAIYSKKSKRFKIHSQDKDGYCRTSLSAKTTNYAIHRFVYACWNNIKISNLEGMTIHHKNNIKQYNYFNNLELVPTEVNTRYAILDGMKKIDTIYTEADIHKMCEMMSKNISYLDIAKEFGIISRSDDRYHGFRSRLLDIRNKRIWKDIASQYDFTNYTGNLDPNQKYTNSDICKIRNIYKTTGSYETVMQEFPNSNLQYIKEIIACRKRINVG